MKLTLGFSPCPNDTFIFHALVSGKVDTEGIEFEYFIADIEDLNRSAFEGTGQVLKLSCHAYAHVSANYLILDSGCAIGRGNGPLLVSKRALGKEEKGSLKYAIPGVYTTANLLFSIARPEAVNKTVYLFSEIPDAILRGEVDAGIIIHETRFTYREKGLTLASDLGVYWEDLTGLPVPLGVIAVNRQIPAEVSHAVNRIIKRSLRYAEKNPAETDRFVKRFSQEKSGEAIRKHIELYVNNFTGGMGAEGRMAVKELFRIAAGARLIPEPPAEIFLLKD